jgi:hypothetical protein
MLRKSYLACGLASLAVALSIGSAEACQGSKVLFEEKFASLDSAWGTDQHAAAAGGKLTLTTDSGPDGWTSHILNQADTYQDVSYCATAAFPVIKDVGNAIMGLIFWGTDDDHYWMLAVSPIGQYSIQHKVAPNRILQPVRWTENPAVAKGAGQKYDLEVQTKGGQATVFVNGAKLGQVSGQPPDGGSLTGVYWSLPNETDSKIEVTGLKVMK